ncbi:MAG: TraR/DksA C4-type zinc finger protein [Candidatus Zixiibacteriota bacterium]
MGAKTKYSKKELEEFEQLLLKKREELMLQQKKHKELLDTTNKEQTGDLSSYSFHMADQGTDNMEREKTFMFASKTGRLLYHIDEALKRLHKGEYGNCHACGKQIKKARLEEVPHARFCIECKSAEETASGRR